MNELLRNSFSICFSFLHLPTSDLLRFVVIDKIFYEGKVCEKKSCIFVKIDLS